MRTQFEKNGSVVSVWIKGMGRFYGWGKTKEEAQEELVAGLVQLVEKSRKVEDSYRDRISEITTKIYRAVRQLS
jgi:hypothetical protein